MKRVAEASKPPVVIPVVVVAVDVHIALVVIPAVEGGNCVRCHPWHCPSNILGAESYVVS